MQLELKYMSTQGTKVGTLHAGDASSEGIEGIHDGTDNGPRVRLAGTRACSAQRTYPCRLSAHRANGRR